MHVRVASPHWEGDAGSGKVYSQLVLRALRTVGVDAAPLPYRCPGMFGSRGGLVGPFLYKYVGRYPPHDRWLVHDTSQFPALRGVDVATVYDLLPYRESTRWTWMLRDNLRLTFRRARRTVVYSDQVHSEVRRLFGPGVAERVRTVYCPVVVPDGPRAEATYDVLWIGSAGPRKQLPMFLEALRGLKPLRVAVRLAERPFLEERTRAASRAIDQLPGVRRLPRLDDAALDRLYRESTCYVSTSRYEGLQLPILEAYLRGTRAVVPDDEDVPAGQLLKGAPGAHFFRPGDITDLRRAITEAVEAGPFVPSHQVRELLSFERVGAAFRALYEELGP